MNGKKARALRRANEPTKRTFRDALILQRSAEHAHLVARTAPKFDKPRRRVAKPGITPTWPHSKDQRKQSRPLIVVKPVRALRMRWLAAAVPDEHGVRTLTSAQKLQLQGLANWPKHAIDARR